ncbi:MAG: ParB/RepB/Spo0J family partition protein [Deltaproteobacteria bacterium]|nr:ParB/RepB/Spo0J family partition protein [Deltaproteobacteria bacterium]
MKKLNDPLAWISGNKKELNSAYIELNKINEDEAQPRTDYGTEEEMEELKGSIKEGGVIEPIIVKIDGDKYKIISGHRRFRACVELGLQDIPAIIKEENISYKDVLSIQLEENLHRKNLTPLELANTYKIYRDVFNFSTRETAEKVHKSQSHVIETLQLLDLPDELKNRVNGGSSPSKVREISKLDKKTQKEVLKNPEKYSRDDIRKLKTKKVETDKAVNKLREEKISEIIEAYKLDTYKYEVAEKILEGICSGGIEEAKILLAPYAEKETGKKPEQKNGGREIKSIEIKIETFNGTHTDIVLEMGSSKDIKSHMLPLYATGEPPVIKIAFKSKELANNLIEILNKSF